MPVEQMAPDLHFQAQRLERLFRNLQLRRLKRGIGRGHESSRVAGCQPLRLDDALALHDEAWHTECRRDRGGRGPEKLASIRAELYDERPLSTRWRNAMLRAAGPTRRHT